MNMTFYVLNKYHTFISNSKFTVNNVYNICCVPPATLISTTPSYIYYKHNDRLNKQQ